MSGRAVAVYDLSGRAGWAVWSPGEDMPHHGVLRLPPTTVEGSCGPAFHLLFDHIAWINRRWPLRALGYEAFISPTGGSKDAGKSFVTSPATSLKLIGAIGIVQCCASMLSIPDVSINNASWRRYWLGSQKRGTDRDRWKELSVAKARALGWEVKGDDEADALGQLHFLLNKLAIVPDWSRYPQSADLLENNRRDGVPIHV